MESVDKAGPLTSMKSQPNSSDWIMNENKNASMERDKLFHLWVQSPSEIKKNLYNRQENIAIKLMRKASEILISKRSEKKLPVKLYIDTEV